MPWIGTKKIAFIPVFRPNVLPPDPPDVIPADWNSDILQRVLFDPDTKTGADRSLRAYIRAASSGRADIDAVVRPMVTIDRKDVRLDQPDVLQLGEEVRNLGFDAAALVMLGLPPAGTSQRGGFLARFVMKEKLGTWAMELMHVLTGFDDIRCQPAFVDCPNDLGDIGDFDEMAFNGGMHPSAYTKAAVQWLDASSIAKHTSGAAAYALHAVGLVQPPPSGRSTAVRIGSEVPYLMVEARLMCDQFESKSQLEPGIPSQGVIVYRVQTSDPLGVAQNKRIPVFLLTPAALAVGADFTPTSSDVTVRVTAAIPGGFSVLVTTPDPGQSPWTTVAEGRSTPGGAVTAVVTGSNRIALFIADPNGGIYTISGFGTNWSQWTTVAEGSSTPGAPVTAVVTGSNRIALFIADPNGGIYTISGFGTNWSQWTTVAEGSSTPGAPVTAVLTGPNRIALFVADPNGGIYTISGFGTNWGQWTPVADGRSTPGGAVTAVVTGQNQIALFLTDPNGGIWTISGFGTNWSQWTTVAEGSSTPGAPVTAVLTDPSRIALFVADPNGGIYTISGFGTNWSQWTTVAEGSSTPGAPVTAVLTDPNRIALFVADPNGGIYTISGFGTNWSQWTTVAEGSSTPGAPVTAVVTGTNRIALFLADPNGGIFTSTKLLLS